MVENAADLPSQSAKDGDIMAVPIKPTEDEIDETDRYIMYVYTNGWHVLCEFTYPPVESSN